MKRVCCAALCALLLLSGRCMADPAAEARKLKDEALEILKANTDKQPAPADYAVCLYKLEKAQGLLDSARDSSSMLAREVNSALFWARRFSNIQVLGLLDKLRAEGGASPPPRRTEPRPPAPPTPPASSSGGPPPEPPEMARLRTGAQAYAEAQKFAAEHKKDEYAAALGWFQMAAQNPGSDYALKALEQARRAWQRFAGKDQKEDLPDVAGMDLVKDGDERLAAGKYEPALELYRSSLKQNDTIITHKRLGKACYLYAQHITEQLKPRLDAHLAKYNAAWQAAWHATRMGARVFDPNDPHLQAWNRQLDQLRKEGDVAQKQYLAAELEFRAVLKLLPEQREFDSAGYVGLCQSVRPFSKLTGQRTLEEFVKSYTPGNDDQRLLYEFCRAEIERLKKGG